MSNFDFKRAQEELSKLTEHQIEVSAAYTWASRAYVAFKNFNSNKDIRWFLDGSTYYHEALEHAALVESKTPVVLQDIKKTVEPVYDQALLTLKKKSFV